MPIGSSHLYIVDQSTTRSPLELDNSYFLVRLHDEQLFFPAGWLEQADHAVVSSSVESTFQPGQATQSLYKVTMVAKNTPVRLGINANLTDWLPSRAADTLKVHLKYSITQGAPFNRLVDQFEQIGLASKVSLLSAEWAVAVKVTQVVGRLLDFLAGAGGSQDLLVLTLDLNLATLQTGYYAMVGSRTDEYWPPRLRVRADGRLDDPGGNSLARLSYLVVEVLTLPRRGGEVARDESWWEVLQAGKDQALSAFPVNREDLNKALTDWRSTLSQVRSLARKSRGFLQREIDALIQAEHVAVQKALLPGSTTESGAALPEEWQELLGVTTERQLYDSVRDYQDALEVARRLLSSYRLEEMP